MAPLCDGEKHRSQQRIKSSTSLGLNITRLPSLMLLRIGRRLPLACAETHDLLTPSLFATGVALSSGSRSGGMLAKNI